MFHRPNTDIQTHTRTDVEQSSNGSICLKSKACLRPGRPLGPHPTTPLVVTAYAHLHTAKTSNAGTTTPTRGGLLPTSRTKPTRRGDDALDAALTGRCTPVGDASKLRGRVHLAVRHSVP
jgi:hypothetical protein